VNNLPATAFPEVCQRNGVSPRFFSVMRRAPTAMDGVDEGVGWRKEGASVRLNHWGKSREKSNRSLIPLSDLKSTSSAYLALVLGPAAVLPSTDRRRINVIPSHPSQPPNPTPFPFPCPSDNKSSMVVSAHRHPELFPPEALPLTTQSISHFCHVYGAFDCQHSRRHGS